MIRPAASSPASKRTSLTAAALVATVGVALAGQVGTDAPTAAALAAPASQPSSQPASQPTPPASDAALSTAQVRGAQAAKAADPVAADALKLDQSAWPRRAPSSGRPRLTRVQDARVAALRQRRDRAAARLAIDADLIAPRAALERVATDGEAGMDTLLPWQQQLIKDDA